MLPAHGEVGWFLPLLSRILSVTLVICPPEKTLLLTVMEEDRSGPVHRHMANADNAVSATVPLWRFLQQNGEGKSCSWKGLQEVCLAFNFFLETPAVAWCVVHVSCDRSLSFNT